MTLEIAPSSSRTGDATDDRPARFAGARSPEADDALGRCPRRRRASAGQVLGLHRLAALVEHLECARGRRLDASTSSSALSKPVSRAASSLAKTSRVVGADGDALVDRRHDRRQLVARRRAARARCSSRPMAAARTLATACRKLASSPLKWRARVVKTASVPYGVVGTADAHGHAGTRAVLEQRAATTLKRSPSRSRRRSRARRVASV